jgi:hypothetical protein
MARSAAGRKLGARATTEKTMAEIINLNRFKKRRAREEEQKRAADNRARFGRSKAEREKAASEAEKAARDLDGNRRD